MRIEVITVGNELLAGSTIDTNFVYLAQRLSAEGYSIFIHTSIPDDPIFMEQFFLEATQRSDIILTTGGLGPTIDDHTKQVVAKVFNKKFVLNKDIRNDLMQRYGPDLISLEHQATVPEGVELLKNKVGTAPGFLFQTKKNSFFVMPGVPLEMKIMFEEEVIPKIKHLLSKESKKFVRRIQLCHLSESNVDPCLREINEIYPQVEAGIYPGYGLLAVEFKIKETTEKKAQSILEGCVQKISEKFSNYIVSVDNLTLPEMVQDWMIKHEKTLILAESCTGGHLAAKLIEIPGASDYLLGSIVCYSNELKKSVLGVREETLSKYGAVSYETVYEMVQGALSLSTADYVLAVSGIAGPSGGSEEKPIGTVWCGLGVRGEKEHIGKILAKGRAKRTSVIEYTANFMLGVLWKKIAYNNVSL